jgi:hypothetical protein
MSEKLYIIIHTHRHGVDVYPVLANSYLSVEQAADYVGDAFEPDREDEYLDIAGPWELTKFPSLSLAAVRLVDLKATPSPWGG